MKKILYIALLLAILFSLSPVAFSPAQAQQEDPSTGPGETLDTVLARATAKSFLVTLMRPELSSLMKFYLLDSVDANEIVTALEDNPVTGFEITNSEWVSDVTYQVKATLQPGNRSIAVYTGKYNGRWRIEGVDLPLAAGTAAPASVSLGAGEVTTTTAGPAVSPVSDNGTGRLVFQTHSGGDIYIINADGTGLRRITNGIDPQLSPDGTKITFTRWEPRYELFTINVDGSNEQAWTHGWREMKSPTWSADGSKITFSYQSGGRLEGERKRVNLTEAYLKGDTPRIPPEAIDFERVTLDGQEYLYYYLPADAHWYLKQIDLNTKQLIDLITERHSYGPSGHPSQPHQVIYKGNTGIAIHDAEASADQPITNDHRDHTPVISPDGSKIAVSYWQDGHWEVHTMNIDGSNRQRLTKTPITAIADKTRLISEEVMGKQRFVAPANDLQWNHAAPTWSPDGSKIAFVTDRGHDDGSWEIWIMNADGSDQRPMFPGGTLDGITLNYAGVDERMLSWR
jgi:Tol biopolymer transport system component